MWREMVVIDEHLQMMEEWGSSRGWLAPQHPSKWCQPGSSDAGVPQLSWCLEENSSEGEKADICLTGKQRTRKAGLFYWCPPLETTTRSTAECRERSGSAENAVKEKGFTQGKKQRCNWSRKQWRDSAVRVVGCVCVSPSQLLEDPGYCIHLRYVPCICTNHSTADTLCLSQGLTDLESSKENWLWGQRGLSRSSALGAEKAASWGNELCRCSIL